MLAEWSSINAKLELKVRNLEQCKNQTSTGSSGMSDARVDRTTSDPHPPPVVVTSETGFLPPPPVAGFTQDGVDVGEEENERAEIHRDKVKGKQAANSES